MADTTKIKHQSLITQLIKDEPGAFSYLKTGDVVEGAVLEKGSRLLLLDLGRYGVGAVYGGELLYAKEMVRDLAPGDRILGKVIDSNNEDGYVEISIAEAGKQRVWDELLELKEKDEVLRMKPSGFNKGGLIAEIRGVKAFLPLSQLSSEHYPKAPDGNKEKITQELQQLLLEEFSVKIIDLNPKTNKLIISERAAAEEGMKELVGQYAIGQIVEGVISGVASFGAFFRFTDNPAVEGLIHISELDHRLIENPKEVVNVDEVVKAKIVDIKDSKVYLSLKALKPDPWVAAGSLYHEGQEVRGTVYAFNPFGATVTLGPIQGHIHVTEFGGVDAMREALHVGSTYTFVVGTVKPEEKRIYLKLKKQ